MKKGVFLFLLVALSVVFVSCEYALGVRLIPLSELNGKNANMTSSSIFTSKNEKYATLTFRYYERDVHFDKKNDKFFLGDGHENWKTIYFNKSDYKFYLDKNFVERIDGYDRQFASLLTCVFKTDIVGHHFLGCKFLIFPDYPDDAKFSSNRNREDINFGPFDEVLSGQGCLWKNIYDDEDKFVYASYFSVPYRGEHHFDFDEWEGINGYMNKKYVKEGYSDVVLVPKILDFPYFADGRYPYFGNDNPLNYKQVGWRSGDRKFLYGEEHDRVVTFQYNISASTKFLELHALWEPI